MKPAFHFSPGISWEAIDHFKKEIKRIERKLPGTTQCIGGVEVNPSSVYYTWINVKFEGQRMSSFNHAKNDVQSVKGALATLDRRANRWLHSENTFNQRRSQC